MQKPPTPVWHLFKRVLGKKTYLGTEDLPLILNLRDIVSATPHIKRLKRGTSPSYSFNDLFGAAVSTQKVSGGVEYVGVLDVHTVQGHRYKVRMTAEEMMTVLARTY